MNNANRSSITLPYQSFLHAKGQLFTIEAIDYFFAKQFTEILLAGYQESTNDTDLIFHLFIALSESLRAGHSCLPVTKLSEHQIGYHCDEYGLVSHQGYVFPPLVVIKAQLNLLALDAPSEHAIVYANDSLYLRRYYNFEQQVVNFIYEKTKRSLTNYGENSENTNRYQTCLNQLFPVAIEDGEIDWQKLAVANALNKSFTVIAGGPGTGKTYTVTKLLAALVALNTESQLSIALVAPTGKAAQRLSESITQAVQGFSGLISTKVLTQIPQQAQTLHRLLGVIPNSPNFKHHKDNLLNIDVLLVDEVSMVDLPLMSRLFEALPTTCKVILLGDAQQLPSVAAGSVLADLTPNKKAKYSKENIKFLSQVSGLSLPSQFQGKHANDYLTYLTKSRRFDGQGGIGRIAQFVINGNSEQSWLLLQNQQIDQLSFAVKGRDWLIPLVNKYYFPLQEAKSVGQAFKLLARFRILAATRVGETGVDQLNQFVEELVTNASEESFISSRLQEQRLYHAKPIMICENDYQLGLYNGDIGLIWLNGSGQLMAMFEQEQGKYASILPSRLPKYETVYAMTIHKTQGSEFGHVAMVLPQNAENQLLSRELLYTGITRAKSHLTIQCEQSVWHQGVERQVERYSGIKFS